MSDRLHQLIQSHPEQWGLADYLEVLSEADANGLCIPRQFRHREALEKILAVDGNKLQQLMPDLITEELCQIAVTQDGTALFLFPSACAPRSCARSR